MGLATRNSVRNKVSSNIYDVVGVYFDTQMINDSIQDGYDEIVTRSQCIEAVTQVNWINGQIYYDLYNCISGCEGLPLYWRPTKLFNAGTNRWMDIVDSRFLDKYRFDWEASNGTPWFVLVWNYRWMGFFPHYVSGAGQFFLLMFKVGRDIILNDTQYLQIPPAYQTTIEYWSTADLLESIGEVTKAQSYFTKYEAKLAQLKIHVGERMLPERYLQLNDLDFPYPTLP